MEDIHLDLEYTAKKVTPTCNISDVYQDHHLNIFYYYIVYKSEKVVQFACLKNFHQVAGNLVLECFTNGSWSASPPTCEVDYYMHKYRLSGFICGVSFLLPAFLLLIDYWSYVRARKRRRLRVSTIFQERGRDSISLFRKGSTLSNISRIAAELFDRVRPLEDILATRAHSKMSYILRLQTKKVRSDPEMSTSGFDVDHDWQILSGQSSPRARNRYHEALFNMRNVRTTTSTTSTTEKRSDKKVAVGGSKQQQEDGDNSFMSLRADHPLVRLGRVVREFLME